VQWGDAWLQVPLEPRFMWRQRLRWLKGGHLFLIGPESIFFKKQKHMSFYAKSLYWLCPIAHIIQCWAEPIIFTLPFMCLVLNVCPYGMDSLLFYTHFCYLAASFACSTWYSESWLRGVAFAAKSSYRVLWFTSVKAVINTIMVVTGYKDPGHFKFTPKTGLAGEDGSFIGDTAIIAPSDISPPSCEIKGSNGQPGKAPKRAFVLKDLHSALSKVTELRRKCMPLDGTLDVWVLIFFMTLSIFSAAIGAKRLIERNALFQWNDNRDSLIWLGVVFACVDATPGLLFMGCAI
jgi:hypothetical protein